MTLPVLGAWRKEKETNVSAVSSRSNIDRFPARLTPWGHICYSLPCISLGAWQKVKQMPLQPVLGQTLPPMGGRNLVDHNTWMQPIDPIHFLFGNISPSHRSNFLFRNTLASCSSVVLEDNDAPEFCANS